MTNTTSPHYKSLQQLWRSPDTFATTLLIMYLDQYGAEGLTWLPATAIMEIESDFNVEMPAVNTDKLMMALTVLQSNSFYKSLPDFINICNVFSGSPLNTDMFDLADAHECAWGMTEAMLIDPPSSSKDVKDQFSEEILAYITEVIVASGMITAPDVLSIVGRNMSDRVAYDYSDDPIMFNSVWDMEKEKTNDINDMVKTRLKALLTQLQGLPLTTGNSKDVATKLLSTFASE